MGPEKDMAQEKKAWRWKKRAWRWEKGAWRGAMLKGAGGNTTVLTPFVLNKVVQLCVQKKKKKCRR